MPVSGFRCPYLSYNNDTLEVLQRGGFEWTSNNMILWRNGNGRNGKDGCRSLKKIGALYNIEYGEIRPALPRFRDRCVDIPITGPDDEMLLERFKVRKKAKIAEVWTNVQCAGRTSGENFSICSSIRSVFPTSGSASTRSSRG